MLKIFTSIDTSFERLLETLAVLFYCSEYLFICIIILIILIYLLFTKYFIIPLLYFSWVYYDRNVHNQGLNHWIRRLSIWTYFVNYFPIKLIKTHDLDPRRTYIFACHPHGLMGCSIVANFGTESTGFSHQFPGLTPHILTLPEYLLWMPFKREYWLSLGFDCRKGQALVLVVGGGIEALDAIPNTLRLTLKHRFGFIKMALKHGTPLVPVLSFGENNVYNQYEVPKGSIINRIQLLVTRVTGITPPLFYGRGLFEHTIGYLAHRKPITTVGKYLLYISETFG
ncbi:unnamed protein product, partial [Oppiella nova]